MDNHPGHAPEEIFMQCKECDRLKRSLYAVVSELINNRPDSALNLARVGMYGGDVNNPLDCSDPKRNCDQKQDPDIDLCTGISLE